MSLGPNIAKHVSAYALQTAVRQGPRSSLGDMPLRNAVLLKITDTHGAYGWGEIWCNFPPRGCLNKLHLIEDVIGPMLIGLSIDDPGAVCKTLGSELGRMIVHTGEPGPFAHCIAGIDTALHDLAARRNGRPMQRELGAPEAQSVPVYASTPPSDHLADKIGELTDRGHRAIKIKIGYGPEKDRVLLEQASKACAQGTTLFADANQSWDVEQAKSFLGDIDRFGLGFIEEPISAHAGLDVWADVAVASSVPLAAGENIGSEERFRAHLDNRSLGVVQPDVAKWGGVSGALAVAKHAQAIGAQCSLHYMGSALGLAASLHTKAVIKGDGFVELDVNENPLRTDLGEFDLSINDGCVTVPKGPGLGFEPDPDAMRRYQIASCQIG